MSEQGKRCYVCDGCEAEMKAEVLAGPVAALRLAREALGAAGAHGWVVTPWDTVACVFCQTNHKGVPLNSSGLQDDWESLKHAPSCLRERALKAIEKVLGD